MRILAIVLAALVAGAPARGETTVPGFWAPKQRLAKPDLSALTRLRFLTTADFFPFNFIDADGRLSGFHVDLARAICAALDMTERCQIQALPWDELEGALAEGQGEALVAGLAITAENREDYLFSRPYMRFPARFVTRRGAVLSEPLHGKMADKRVGVIDDTAHERLLRDLFPEAQAVVFSRNEWLLDALRSGAIDAAFGDGMRFSFWLAGEDAARCCAFSGGPYLAPGYLGHGLAVAVPRDMPELAEAIDFALHEIEANGAFAELYRRYFPVGFY